MIFKLFIFIICVYTCTASIGKKSKFIRPCHLNNYKCIQNNLAANSRCKLPVKRTIPPVYKVDYFRFDTPYFNATFVETDLLIIGQDRCFVSEFYWNVADNTGVLGIDCPWLTIKSNRTMYQHRPLREDTVYCYSFEGTYPLIRLTTTLAYASRLDLCKEFTSAFVAQVPKQKIVPLDKRTANFLSRDGRLTDIFECETFFWRATKLARVFVNNILCDFGCY